MEYGAGDADISKRDKILRVPWLFLISLSKLQRRWGDSMTGGLWYVSQTRLSTRREKVADGLSTRTFSNPNLYCPRSKNTRDGNDWLDSVGIECSEHLLSLDVELIIDARQCGLDGGLPFPGCVHGIPNLFCMQ